MGAATGIPVVGEVVKTASSLWGDVSGANAAAEAAQGAAMAQLAESRRVRAKALELAQASPEELATLGRSYSAAEKSLAREEKLLSAIDPALMEASKQALSLLRGETADINKPLMDQRNMQRQQLLNSLRAQYGPGAETSSIGSRILQQFDMESNSMFAQNQRSSLGQVFDIAGADFGGRTSRSIHDLMGVSQGYGNIAARKANAWTGTSTNVINSSGAPFVGDALRAQGQQQFFNTALGLGSLYAMGGFGGGGTPAPGYSGQTMAGGSYLPAGNIG